MLNDIILGQYMPTGSFIHKASPKLKIISLFILTICIFMIKSFWLYFYLLGFCWIILRFARLKAQFLWRGLKPLIFLFLITFVLNILFTEGTNVIWQFGIITITEEGLSQAFVFFMRVMLLVIFSTLLTLTTSPIELSDGIEECLRPLKYFKFPVHEFSLMLTIALRFIPTLVSEVDKIKRAQEARGANFSDGNIFKKLSNFIPLLIPLFIMSFKRADELAVAMESRCYAGGAGRTKYKRRHESFYDYLMFVIVLAVIFPVLVIYFKSFSGF
ncbi:MAG: energy-coupling factor transporter transmembrane component T [Candidatus Wallbacteria bacterium]